MLKLVKAKTKAQKLKQCTVRQNIAGRGYKY